MNAFQQAGAIVNSGANIDYLSFCRHEQTLEKSGSQKVGKSVRTSKRIV
jgi:hypothetical protein